MLILSQKLVLVLLARSPKAGLCRSSLDLEFPTYKGCFLSVIKGSIVSGLSLQSRLQAAVKQVQDLRGQKFIDFETLAATYWTAGRLEYSPLVSHSLTRTALAPLKTISLPQYGRKQQSTQVHFKSLLLKRVLATFVQPSRSLTITMHEVKGLYRTKNQCNA
jgi:hypothetical protein